MTITSERATTAAAATAAVVPRPLARAAGASWPAIMQDRAAVWAQLSGAPFNACGPGSRHRDSHPTGLALLLDWLEGQPGDSWQDRWLASGADAGNGAWRQVPLAWLRENGHRVAWRADALLRALRIAVAADLTGPR